MYAGVIHQDLLTLAVRKASDDLNFDDVSGPFSSRVYLQSTLIRHDSGVFKEHSERPCSQHGLR